MTGIVAFGGGGLACVGLAEAGAELLVGVDIEPDARILMNAPERYDEALRLVTKTSAYRILGNGVDRTMSRVLLEAVKLAGT